MSSFVKGIALAGAMVLLAAASASANRLIIIPTGSTFSSGGIKGEYAKRSDGGAKAYWVNVGVSRLEVEWAGFREFGPKNEDAFSAQLSVLPETTFMPAVAVGVRDIGDSTNRSNGLYDGRSFYLAATKGIPITGGIPLLFHDVKLHGGVGTGSLSGVFFGAEAQVPFGLRLAGEYDTEKFNFQLSYSIIPALRATISSIEGDIYYGAYFQTAL